MMRKHNVVNGNYLAKYCNVSLATIRKEITNLNEYLKEHGCQVASRKSLGYYFDITDQEKLTAFQQELSSGMRRNNYLKIHKYMDCYLIIRTLLTSSHYVSIEQLCDQLYCSKSTITRNLDLLKTLISPFHLEIKNSFNKGLYLEGSEWNIRNYLQYQHKIYSSLSPQDKAKEQRFAAMFMEREIDQHTMKKSVMEALQTYHDITLPYIYIFKLINCIILNKTRAKYQSEIRFTKKQELLIKDSNTYAIAKDIYNLLPPIFQDYSDKDIMILSAYLLSYQSIKDSSLLPQGTIKDLKNFTITMFQEIYPDFYQMNAFSEEFIKAFVLYLYTLQNRLCFQLSIDEEMVEHINHDGVYTTDLCVKFAKYYEAYFHVQLQETELLSSYYLLHQVRVSTRWLIKQRFLIASMYGAEHAKAIAHYIKRAYRYNIDTIEAVELFDIASMPLFDYDALFTDIDIDKSMLPENIKVIPIEFKRDYRNDPQIEKHLSSIRTNRIRTLLSNRIAFQHVQVKKKQDIFTNILQHYIEEVRDGTAFLDDLRKRDTYINGERSNKIVLLTSFESHAVLPAILVMVNQQPIVWRNEASQIFIYYSYGTHPMDTAFAVSNIIKFFIDCPIEKFDELLQLDSNDILEMI